MRELRLALIGCGSHSEHAHAKPLEHYCACHAGEVELVAACDQNSERAARFCREYGFATAYENTVEMLDREKPDAVIAVVPIGQTPRVGADLLRRGIPCVLEKPPGASLSEARGLAEIARQTRGPHMVSMNRRFNPFLNRAVDWTRQIGPLQFVRATMLRNARREEEFLWGTGIHVVDVVRYIGGEVAEHEVRRVDAPAGSAPWYQIVLRFVSGCRGSIEIMPTCGAVDETFEVSGDGFHTRVHTMGAAGESVRRWRDGTLLVEEASNVAHALYLRDGSYEETTAFINAVRDGTPLHPTLSDVLPSLEICSQGESTQ